MKSVYIRMDRSKLVQDYLDESKALRDRFDAEHARLTAALEAAEAAEKEDYRNPVVLVRMSLGQKRKVYHSLDGRCGKTKYDGGSSEAFKRMKESEAKDMDGGILVRCTACDWD